MMEIFSFLHKIYDYYIRLWFGNFRIAWNCCNVTKIQWILKKQNTKFSFPILFRTWRHEHHLNVTHTQTGTSHTHARARVLHTKVLDTELCQFGLKGLSKINCTVAIVSVLTVSLLNARRKRSVSFPIQFECGKLREKCGPE